MARTVLVCGTSTSGKTSSMENLKNPEKVLFLNAEVTKGEDLPFKNNFMKRLVLDPLAELAGPNNYFRQAAKNSDKIETIVLDSFTLMTEMYVKKYVKTVENKLLLKAWGELHDFLINVLTNEIPPLKQNVIITAHTTDIYNNDQAIMEHKVKLPGSISNIGFEAYFNNIVSCKKVGLDKLQSYDNPLLHITEDDEINGYKHVIQTRLTKDTRYERIRSNRDMWDVKETYIDNDIQLVLNRLNEYYGD